MIINTKERFVYTGSKDTYNFKLFNSDKVAKVDSNNKLLTIIEIEGWGRGERVFETPLDAIEYAKKKIEVKSLPKQKTYATGRARIFFIDTTTNKEFLAAVVNKNTKRYFEPVSRFNHEKT